MIKIIRWLLIGSIGILIFGFGLVWYQLSKSLPELDGQRTSPYISAAGNIQRDKLGTAIINAQSQTDAAFLLGFAHAQDRYFQMDLLRRSAAGELSELIGKATIRIDKKARFHQFRKRAKLVLAQLPKHEKNILNSYTKGVNQALAEMKQLPFEYLLIQASPKPWAAEDSLLASYSMYLDLQGNQIERDLTLTLINDIYGHEMLDFLNLPSPYQAALDGSEVQYPQIVDIPQLPPLQTTGKHTDDKHLTSSLNQIIDYNSIIEPDEIGSNNWAVTGALTDTTSALLSNDMHLSLRIPAIWYRAQLNYTYNNQRTKVTGVSLPGTPAVIVGSNGHVAWGFTNSNLDNVEWVKLNANTATNIVTEQIKVKQQSQTFELTLSEYGPVRKVNGQKYALQWVAHELYGVDMTIAELAHQQTVKEALSLSTKSGIAAQNMMVVDKLGNAAWKPTGAVAMRSKASLVAIDEKDVSALWSQQEQSVPSVINPASNRLWTANDRIISNTDLPRFGNGGYALGARGLQIKQGLFAKEQFDEQAFYELQLDNKAIFLTKWHRLLLSVLQTQADTFQTDIEHLTQWQACACSDSIGYSLTRRFRSTVINQLLAPIEQTLKKHEVSTRPIYRAVEPAIWEILTQHDESWLPSTGLTTNDEGINAVTIDLQYNTFLLEAYKTTRQKLIKDHKANSNTLAGLEWGNVNKLKVNHPIAAQVGPFASLLNMNPVNGFGDSFMPAVQGTGFGASQRLIVRPGEEHKAILTVPGGQSGHPLSKFFRTGFEDYANARNTPLLPSEVLHELTFTKQD